MKVKELIEKLSMFNKEMEVRFLLESERNFIGGVVVSINMESGELNCEEEMVWLKS